MSGERQSLVMSLSDLTRDVQDSFDQESNLYATSEQAFYDQNIFEFVMDEVHAMMQIMCCKSRTCGQFYNPFYTIAFGILYCLTLPGAYLHYILLSCVPVRYKEYPEERELRSQGIYTALGISLLSIPFAILSLYYQSSSLLRTIIKTSILVNISLIIINLMALKAIVHEYRLTIRLYILGVWFIDAILIGLALFDTYEWTSITWELTINFCFRMFEIFVYTIIGVQCLSFWHFYDRSIVLEVRSKASDTSNAFVLGMLIGFIVFCFMYAIIIAESNAWRIMYW